MPSVGSEFLILVAHNISQFLTMHPFKGSGRLKGLVPLFVPAPDGPTIVHTNFGFEILVDPVFDKGLEGSIYYHGTYEAGTLNVIKGCLRKGDSFIDIGSNIGLMSLFASQLIGENGTVYSFEPEPETFGILKKNIEINKRNNILTFDTAIGSETNTATIYSGTRGSRGSASLIKPDEKNSSGKEVQVQTLDEFIAANTISNIRMIKIDVEGWELEVLKGARQLLGNPNAPIVSIEYSGLHPVQNGQLLEVYKYILSVNDYGVYKLEKGKEIVSKLIKIEDVSDLPYHDNLFCFLPSHLKSIKLKMS